MPKGIYKISEQHRKKISDSLKKAYADGRMKCTLNAETARLAQEAIKNNPSCKIIRIEKSVLKMKGRPQRMELCTAKKEDNQCAKIWIFKAPNQKIYKFKNLSNFLRTHKELFNEKDLETYGKAGSMSRAAAGLRGLFTINKKTGMPRHNSWKGWMIGDKFNISECKKESNDVLEQ